MVIKGKIRTLKWEDKQKVSFFVSQRLRHPYGGEKGGEERKKRKKRKKRKEKKKKKEKNKGMFSFFLWNQVSFGCLGLLV